MKRKLMAWFLLGAVLGIAACGPSEERSGSASNDSAYYAEISAPEADTSYMDSIYNYDTDVIDQGTEEYSDITETGFASVARQPLSTFAADVDTASYSNLRRMIRDGYGIDDFPEGSVRIEEMLNYFTYDYKLPESNEPFGVTTEIAACPWNPETELLMIGLKTQDIDYSKAPASNLVFLLDVSGSMEEPDKLPLLQESFAMLTENLSGKDRVSIVTYAGSDDIVLEGVKGSETQIIKEALYDLNAAGGTHGSAGIITAYELAEAYFIEGGNNRVILATDGDLNVGLTTEDELEELISQKRESGIFLSVLGFGTGNIKDNNMETLADKGNGNYAYIDSERESRKVLVQEMGATLLTVCKDVKFQVEFNPAVVQEYRLIGYENRRMAAEDFKDDSKDAGEIGAGHSVTALYEVKLTEPLTGIATSDLKYAENHEESPDSIAQSEEWLTISIRYKKPSEDTASQLDYPVDYRSYRDDPSQDWKFAAAVAEFGLLASQSENKGEASLDHVLSVLEEMTLHDEYREEFYELAELAYRN